MLAGTEGRTLVRAEIGHEENDYGRSRGRVVVARTHDEEEEEMSPEHTTTTSGADALTSRLTRTVLQQSPSSIPGREIVQVLTEIPAGVESGWHIHPGEEVGYIVAGTVRMMIEGRSPLILPAGSPFLIPPRVPHNALDLGPDTGRMLSTYIVEVDQPLSTFTEPKPGE